MKHRLFAAVFALAVVAAVPTRAAQSLLTPDGVRYTVVNSAGAPHVEIARAAAGSRAHLMVPSTQDVVRESQVQLAFDSATDTLFVVWTREHAGLGEVRYATLSATGHWSPARLVSAGSSMYRGVQLVLTHAHADGIDATLMHVAWWSINGPALEPEYALFAFENGSVVSAEVEKLEDLAGVRSSVETAGYELEAGSPLHPPLALDRRGDRVDVAFGFVGSTAISRVTVVPEKEPGEVVRIWKPLGRNGTRTPRAGLTSIGDAPVQAYMDNGHLALYTIGEEFNFVVLRNSGRWSPVHTLPINSDNTAADLLRELENTVEELLDDEEGDEEAAASR